MVQHRVTVEPSECGLRVLGRGWLWPGLMGPLGDSPRFQEK